jgi:hypothetical protein
MKLEYVPKGASECPLIRLFDFSAEDIKQFREAISRLASGESQRLEVHDLARMESIGNCRLTFFVQNRDQGVVKRSGNDEGSFECGFTMETWDNIEGLVEPFTNGGEGFQWLGGATGEAALLISCDGSW